MMNEHEKHTGIDVDSSSEEIASDNGDMSFHDDRSPSDTSTDEDARNRLAARYLGFSETEQKIVNYSRLAFLFCLLSSAVALAVTVFYIGQLDEKRDFQEEVRLVVPFLDNSKPISSL